MSCEFKERRSGSDLEWVVNEALDIAARCGWRYALAYLIREEVAADVIQRLLSGQCRRAPHSARAHRKLAAAPCRNAQDQELMKLLHAVELRRSQPG